MRSLLFCFLLFVCNFSLVGQTYRFELLTRADGLSQNSVKSICQDDKGFLWFGTTRGISIYDGYDFHDFSLDIGESLINSNEITSMCLDKKQRVWIGTNRGLFVYKTEENKLYPISENTSSAGSLCNIGIRSLCCDSDGGVWIGTNSGVSYANPSFSADSSEFQSYFRRDYNEDFSVKVHTISIDSNKNKWVGTNKGLFLIKANGSIVRNVGNFNSVKCILVDGNKLYVGGNEGLYVGTVMPHNPHSSLVNVTPILFNKQELRNVSVLSKGRDGDVWIGTQGSGLFLLDKSNDMTVWSELIYGHDGRGESNFIHCSFVDKYGNEWFGSDYGIARYVRSDLFSLVTSVSSDTGPLPVQDIHAIYRNNNFTLIGMKGRGLGVLQNNSLKGIVYDFNKDTGNSVSIRFIKECTPNHFLIGTQHDGLYYVLIDFENLSVDILQHYTSKNGLLSNSVYSAELDGDNILWLGTSEGISLIDMRDILDVKLGKIFYTPSCFQVFNETLIYDLCFDSDKTMWIGTIDNGLTVSDISKGVDNAQFRNISYGSKINAQTSIFTITIASDATAYVGTEVGLLVLRKTIKNLYNNSSGLSDEFVFGIACDANENVWISTSNGLNYFDKRKKTFKVFNREDGLQENEFNGGATYVSAHNGEIVFGGKEGFNIIEENVSLENKIAPIPVFTGVRLISKTIHASDSLEVLSNKISNIKLLDLSNEQNSVGFMFSSFPYSNRNQFVYRYRLMGLSSEWLDNGTQNSVFFTSLVPGDYKLEIQASSGGGNWSGTGIIEFSIDSPWYLKWYSCLVYIIFVATAMYFISLELKSKYRLQKNIKAVEHEKKNIELLNEQKLDFFTNLSHEFRTPLTLIISPLEELLVKQGISGDFKSKLNLMHRNANHLNDLMEEILIFRKIKSNSLNLSVQECDLVSFLSDQYEMFRDVAFRSDIEYSFGHKLLCLPIYFDSRMMSKVFKNLLSNAFKYTPKGGNVSIKIIKYNEYVDVVVSDNGKGIAPEYIGNVFDRFFQVNGRAGGVGIGLSLVKQIVELHSGTIRLESTLGEGSTFTISLPLGTEHLSQEFFSSESCLSEPKKKYFPKQSNSIIKSLHTGSNDQKISVLIVEDNQELLDHLQDGFQDEYNVYSAENGAEALVLLNNNHIDLIISDYSMPVMDGKALLCHLKSGDKFRFIPFIMLSARTSSIHKTEIMELGADAYFSKPFHFSQIQLFVRNMMNREKMISEKNLTNNIFLPSQSFEISSGDEEFKRRLYQVIEENIQDSELNVERLSQLIGISRIHLYRRVKKILDLSPNELIRKHRLHIASRLLSENTYSVADVSYSVGMNEPRYFSRLFKKEFGVSPKDYSKSYTPQG